MTDSPTTTAPIVNDGVGNTLKWALLAVAVVTFALFGWATRRTYQLAPPTPARFVAPDGATVLAGGDIVAGKAGFQRADLMDYGSLYGMGSYFGEDYTATNLVKLATLTEQPIAAARFGRPRSGLSLGERFEVKTAMQHALQSIDLTRSVVALQAPVAQAITTLAPQARTQAR